LKVNYPVINPCELSVSERVSVVLDSVVLDSHRPLF